MPENRQKTERWQQFLEVVEETWFAHIEPELERMRALFSIHANPIDREKRMAEWGTRFLPTANHLSPEIAIQQVQVLAQLKNTETLWKAYGRQLGFEEDDISVQNKYVQTRKDYEAREFEQSGALPTSRFSLSLNLRNARWYTQPISSPANLLQEYAEQTRPAHIVLEAPIMEALEDTVIIKNTGYSGFECEKTCRISL